MNREQRRKRRATPKPLPRIDFYQGALFQEFRSVRILSDEKWRLRVAISESIGRNKKRGYTPAS